MTISAGALGVHDALGNALAVEVRHFLKEQKIFKYDGAARAHGEGVLVVADGTPGVCGHYFFIFWHDFSLLVELSLLESKALELNADLGLDVGWGFSLQR